MVQILGAGGHMHTTLIDTYIYIVMFDFFFLLKKSIL